MKNKIYRFNFILFCLLLLIGNSYGQSRLLQQTNVTELQRLSMLFHQAFTQKRASAEAWARDRGLPIRYTIGDEIIMELQDVIDNCPIYYTTENFYAARTVAVDQVWPGDVAGLSLTGAGLVIGEWDGGGVLVSHREFDGRVTQVDSAMPSIEHATHVAGTLIAKGVYWAAIGMAFESELDAYDWNDDMSEMALAAASGLLLSNHSYGLSAGWVWEGGETFNWSWSGVVSISETEDYKFGFYNQISQSWDHIAQNAPYYLMVTSVGNDRDDFGPAPGEEYLRWNGSEWIADTTPRDRDGGDDGYDCIPGGNAVAKNILTVGAIFDMPQGYSEPTDVVMSRFSSWGPADDGRIKPDIVANGTLVTSTSNRNDSAYTYKSGTSMAAANVTGALALLQQYYQNTHDGQSLKAATMKALVLHTTDKESSDPGPNYRTGWGVLNTKAAAEMITKDQYEDHVIQEITLNEKLPYSITVHSNGIEPLFVTIVWTDPPGLPPTPQLNPTVPMLVNDLDLRITRNSDGYVFYPWRLDPQNPAAAATYGDNDIDNVEQVYIETPTHGDYTVTVNHKGTLETGSQDFAMIISSSSTEIKLWASPTVLDFGTKDTELTFLIKNLGHDTLVWNFANATFKSWISSINPSNGINETLVTVTIDRRELHNNNDTEILRIVSNGGEQNVELQITKNLPKNLPSHWNFTSSTGDSAIIELPLSANPNIEGIPLAQGDYIGVFTAAGLCCGWQQWQNKNMSIIAWGDDNSTAGIDGFQDSELVYYRIFQADEQKEWTFVQVEYSGGTGHYLSGSTMVLNKFDVGETKTRELAFNSGWNMISINVIPPNSSIDSVMAPIINNLVIIKNSAGQTYMPSYGINEIGDIDFREGYQVNLKNAQPLKVIGLPVDPTTPILLSTGWSIISYLPEVPIDVATALSSIEDQLIVAKDNAGRTYLPGFGINTIGYMLPNQGYQVDMTAPDTLIYPESGSVSPEMIADAPKWEMVKAEHFQSVSNTGTNSIIVITKENPPKFSDGQLLKLGDEIGMFTNSGICAGVVVWQGVNAAITVWGDDSQTDNVDGFKSGEQFNCRVWQKSTGNTYFARLNLLGEHSASYQTNGFYVVKELTVDLATKVTGYDESFLPSKFKLLQNYPNPFNMETTIEFHLPVKTTLELSVYDLKGQKLTKLLHTNMSAGYHKIYWDGKDNRGRYVASGVYFYRLKSNSFIKTRKMLLIR